MTSVLNPTFSKVITKENNKASDPLRIFQDSDEEMVSINEMQAHDVREYLQRI